MRNLIKLPGLATSALRLALTALCIASCVEAAQATHVKASHELRISTADEGRAHHLHLPIGSSLILDLPTDASEVFVANPATANAVVRSPRRIYIIGLASGDTDIFVMNKEGRKIALLDVDVGRDIDELRRILATAIPGNDIHVQTVKDTVILTGTVDSAADAQKAGDIAQAFVGYTVIGGAASGGQSSTNISLGGTQVVNGSLINSLVIKSKDQVMLRVTVAEVQRDIIKQLGISPNGTWTGGSFSIDNTPTGATQPASYLGSATSSAGVVSSFIGGFGGAMIGSKSGSILADIQAFERDGVARVLAEPTVVAISGESAKFTAGGEIPVTSQSSINPSTGVCTVTTTLTPYGVTLNFTPTVLSEGRISLHLATEVTEVDPTSAVQYACSNAIGFRTRKNETTVELPSGGSIMSAGLIQQTNQQVIAGVPGLMNLPILGTLFRSRDYQRQESELVIIVTPYIAKTLNPSQIARPDDGFADASDPESMFLGRVNRIYSTSPSSDAILHYNGPIGFIQN